MPDSRHPALCTVRLARAAIVLAVFSLYCGQASAVITAEEMRAVLQSAFPDGHIHVDPDGLQVGPDGRKVDPDGRQVGPDGLTGAVALGQTVARWRFDHFGNLGVQSPSSLAAGVEIQVVRFDRFVPPYRKSDYRKRPLPLPTLLICRNSAGEWKWAKIEEHASALQMREPGIHDFIGNGRTQIQFQIEVAYPDVAGRAIVARRRLLYDVDSLELLFAGSEDATASTETHRLVYYNTFEFDYSVDKGRSLLVGEPRTWNYDLKQEVPARHKFSIKWEDNSYAYVDDMPWLGKFQDAEVRGFEPDEKTVSIKLPDGAPAFGAEYTLDRTLYTEKDLDRTFGTVGVDGLIKFTPGATTELSIRFKSYYEVKRVIDDVNNAFFEVIQLEQEHPAIKACARNFVKVFETYEDISDIGFSACDPAEKDGDAEFSVASQDADFVFRIMKRKAERLSPFGVRIPHIEFDLQLAGQNGWEVQSVPSLSYEEDEVLLRAAPEDGYTQVIAIDDPAKANAFVRNVKDGRYGKLVNINSGVVERNKALTLEIGMRSVIQSEPQNTRSLRVVEKN